MLELIFALGTIALIIQRIQHNRKIRRILTENDSQRDIME